MAAKAAEIDSHDSELSDTIQRGEDAIPVFDNGKGKAREPSQSSAVARYLIYFAGNRSENSAETDESYSARPSPSVIRHVRPSFISILIFTRFSGRREHNPEPPLPTLSARRDKVRSVSLLRSCPWR